MSPNTFARRLDRIEEAMTAPDRRPAFVWQNEIETVEEAQARHLQEHPEDRGARLTFIRWLREGEAA